VFVRPSLSEWQVLTRRNTAALSTIALRSGVRTELLNVAVSYTTGVLNCPAQVHPEMIIATGHQPVWQHCGIWAKSLVANRFAESLGGHCVFLVLDHDICSTDLFLPPQTGNPQGTRTVGLESHPTAMPVEFRSTCKPVSSFIQEVVDGRPEQFCSSVWNRHMRQSIHRTPGDDNVSDSVTYLHAVLNRASGLDRILYLPVSLLSHSTGFLDFVAHIVQHARAFADMYNHCIDRQIEAWGIKPKETLRQLKIDDDCNRVELPFWLVSACGHRCSLNLVFVGRDQCKVLADSNVLASVDLRSEETVSRQLERLLISTQYRLRPKAVTLTLFTRLFLADWFVHGVGGTFYETITDRLIEDYYGITGLSFGTVTATMTFAEQDQTGRGPANVPSRRQMYYNPERFLPPELFVDEETRNLVSRKRELIKESRDGNLSRTRRHLAWQSLGDVNRHLRQVAASQLVAADMKSQTIESPLAEADTLASREYFFGLFRESTLQELAQDISFESR